MKRAVKSLFSFSKKELNGTLVLLIVLLLVLAATLSLPYFMPQAKADFTLAAKELAAIAQTKDDTVIHAAVNKVEDAPTETRLFDFDPNTATFSQLKTLGLQENVIANLLKYRSKGGFFKTKKELKKIYGLALSDYRRIAPFINIKREREVQKVQNLPADRRGEDQVAPAERETYPFDSPEKIHRKIEINSADTVMLKSLPGIGTVLSARIVKFRERLGGFYAIDQLREVYGLKKETFELIKPMLKINIEHVQKLNINKATADELLRLPYWSKTQVKALVAYRDQHGDFSSINDIKNIRALDSAQIQKIMPYLSF